MGREEQGGPSPFSGSDSHSPAWEGEGGLFTRLARTTWQVLWHPQLTLGAPAQPGLGWPLGYALILGTLAAVLNAFWSRLVGFPSSSEVEGLLSLIFIPLRVAISLFIGSAVVHFCLWVLRGTSAGYTGTFRVAAYSQAAAICYVLPWVGWPLGALWTLIITIAGLAGAHGTSRWRAFWALFLPTLVVGILLLMLVLAFGLGALIGVAQKARVFSL